MTFEEIDRLHWEILRFLWTCPCAGKRGHPYRLFRIRDIQINVLESIRDGQYILFRNANGDIEHFISYWRVTENDIEPLRVGNKPEVLNRGNMIYINEHGNKGGRKSMTKMVRELRSIAADCKGVFWHNWNRNRFEVFYQRGN